MLKRLRNIYLDEQKQDVSLIEICQRLRYLGTIYLAMGKTIYPSIREGIPGAYTQPFPLDFQAKRSTGKVYHCNVTFVMLLQHLIFILHM